MFGYFGIGVIVVCKVMLLLLGVSQVYADVFSQENPYSKKQAIYAENKINDVDKILIFINPQCSWCQKSLRNMEVLKKNHPELAVQVYVMSSIKEFIEFVHSELPSLPVGLDYILDVKNMIANSYGVRRTPTYIILAQGQTKKVEGYVDLNHFTFMSPN